MSWRREPFRARYRAVIGTADSSNSYVSYLNLVDELVGGLDERVGVLGGDGVLEAVASLPKECFTVARSPENCASALRAYLTFVGSPSSAAGPKKRACLPPLTHAAPADHAADELVSLLRDAKALAARYYRLTGRPLGVTGEVAELEAAEKLGLILVEARSPGHDALGADGWRIQVKGRAVLARDRYRGRCPSIKGEVFDSVVLVLLDRASYDTLEIWEAPRDSVLARLDAPGGKGRNERRSLAITQFRSIATRVWPLHDQP